MQRGSASRRLDASWEAFGQGRDGQVDVVRVGDGVDLDGRRAALRTAGVHARRGPAPAPAGSGSAAPDLVAQIDADLTPVQQNVAVLPDDHLVLMSDNAAYLSAATAVAKGSTDGLEDVAGVGAWPTAAGDPVAATQWASTFACEDL